MKKRTIMTANNRMHQHPSIILILSIIMIVLSGCNRNSSESLVIARIGNSVLTAEEMDKVLGTHSLGQDSARIKMDFIDRWVKKELLYRGALRAGYNENKHIRDEVNRFRKQLITNAYLDKVLQEQLKNTEDEIQEFYQKNIDDYIAEETYYVVLHNTVKTVRDARRVQLELKKGIALEDIQSEDLEISTGFLSLIQNPLPEKRIPKELLKEINKLKVGETSRHIPYEKEYHIIKLVDKILKGKPFSLYYVRKNVLEKLFIEKEKEGFDELVKELMEDTDVYVYGEAEELLSPEEEKQDSTAVQTKNVE